MHQSLYILNNSTNKYGDKMKLQTIIVFIVCLLIVGTALIFIVEDDSDITNNAEEIEDDPLLALGEDASYNDAVNAFSFNLF